MEALLQPLATLTVCIRFCIFYSFALSCYSCLHSVSDFSSLTSFSFCFELNLSWLISRALFLAPSPFCQLSCNSFCYCITYLYLALSPLDWLSCIFLSGNVYTALSFLQCPSWIFSLALFIWHCLSLTLSDTLLLHIFFCTFFFTFLLSFKVISFVWSHLCTFYSRALCAASLTAVLLFSIYHSAVIPASQYLKRWSHYCQFWSFCKGCLRSFQHKRVIVLVFAELGCFRRDWAYLNYHTCPL